MASLTSSPPRISFSNNLDQHKHENYSYFSDSTPDFDFCINNTQPQVSSADELFSDGLVLPLQLQEKFVTISKPESLVTRLNIPEPKGRLEVLPTNGTTLNLSLPPLSPPSASKEIVSNDHTESEQKHQPRSSFWKIKRSSSLHSVSSDHKKSPFWPFPLLSRSNSTGSIKQSTANTKQQKRFMPSSSSQKPPFKKSYGGSIHSNGARINPVINVQPPCNIKGITANFLGFGYLFRNGKDIKYKN